MSLDISASTGSRGDVAGLSGGRNTEDSEEHAETGGPDPGEPEERAYKVGGPQAVKGSQRRPSGPPTVGKPGGPAVQAANRSYEMLIIFDPALDDRLVNTTLQPFLSVITRSGGDVQADVWGKRRLAYRIAKKDEGVYAFLRISAAPAAVLELDRQLKLSEVTLRTKVIRAQ